MPTVIYSRNNLATSLAVVLLLWGTNVGASEGAVLGDPVRVSQALFYWQDHALDLIKKYQLNPLRASRALAAMHLAAWDAQGKRGSSLGECAVLAVDVSASRVLDYLFPQETPGAILATAELRSPRNALCAPYRVYASKVADQTIARLHRDGAFPPRRIRPTPHSLGSWRPTPPVYAVLPTEPFAGEWRLYSAESPATFPLSEPITPAADAYLAATMEVVTVAFALTPDQIAAAEAWHLDAGSVTPPGVWNLRLRHMLPRNNTSADIVQLLAAINIAMYDALVVCWHYKYTYWTERPATATVRLQLGEFKPRLVTPPFPSYPSGHATVSGAAAEVIGALLPESKNEALALAREAADSRLWGGIHFRFDNDAGLDLGKSVGAAALRAIQSKQRQSR